MSALEDVLQRIDNNNFASQDASNLAVLLKSKRSDRDFAAISQDDIERIELVSMLLSNQESSSNRQIRIDGNNWRKIGEVFQKLKFFLDDLTTERIITSPTFFLGGGCFFEIVDNQGYRDFLYREVKAIIRKVTDRATAPITVYVEKTTYYTDENVRISGTLSEPSPTIPVLIQILDPARKIARLDQVEVQSAGSYHYEFRIGPTFRVSGTYKVLVSYRDTLAEASFNYNVTESEADWKTHQISINDFAFSLRVKIKSAAIQSIGFSSGPDYVNLAIGLSTQSDGTLTIEIPRRLLDSKSTSGTDEPFAVFADEVAVGHEELQKSPDSRTLRIDFEAGSEQVDITGNRAAVQDLRPMEPVEVKTSEHAIQFEEDQLLRHFSHSALGKISYKKASKIQSKNLTVLFWDIRGFSQLTDDLREYPNLVVKFLREYYHQARTIIYQEGGMLDKFMGDGVLAVFCYPTDDGQSTDDAVHAVSAALKMRERFPVLKVKWTQIWNKNGYQGEVKIGIGCGINTGRAIFGRIGSDKNDQLTVIGSAVNLAKRLESEARSGQILISMSTWSHVNSNFRFGKPVKRKLKGYRRTIPVFSVLR